MPDEQSMIEDLRELEEQLRKEERYRQANIIDLFIKYSIHCKFPKEILINEIRNRQFELQQEYIDFKDDIKLNTLQNLLEEIENGNKN